jgi:hypothetical protein
MMPRPQFTLKTLLWLMAVVAALCGGMAIQRHLDTPQPTRILAIEKDHKVHVTEKMTTPDGKTWERRFLAADEPKAD